MLLGQEEEKQHALEIMEEVRRKIKEEQEAVETAIEMAAVEAAEQRRQAIASRKAADKKIAGVFKGAMSHRYYSKSEAIKNQMFERFVIGSTKYFVTSIFIIVTLVLLSIDFYTPKNVCCIFNENVTTWMQNDTRAVFSSAYNETTNMTQTIIQTEAWVQSGVDRATYCTKYVNPHERFMDVCDDGTARRKVFTSLAIVTSCLFVSLFLVFCRLRSKIRRRDPIPESIVNLAVYFVFVCVPICRVPFEIINGDEVGLGSDTQLILCGVLTWTWLFFMGKDEILGQKETFCDICMRFSRRHNSTVHLHRCVAFSMLN